MVNIALCGALIDFFWVIRDSPVVKLVLATVSVIFAAVNIIFVVLRREMRTSFFEIFHKLRSKMHFSSVVERPVVRRENRESREVTATQTAFAYVNGN